MASAVSALRGRQGVPEQGSRIKVPANPADPTLHVRCSYNLFLMSELQSTGEERFRVGQGEGSSADLLIPFQ